MSSLKSKIRHYMESRKTTDDLYKLAARIKTVIFKPVPDKVYLAYKYRVATGKKLDLDNPTTYNEKLQWLKLYDRNPVYTTMVDKYRVKEYVANIIGAQYVIPSIGCWEKFDDIDFDLLPNQFVLKCNHDCGSVVICRDKRTFNVKEARRKLEKALRVNYYWGSREWQYKNVQPLIFAEEFMEDSKTGELRDYKFFTFNGVPKALFIATDRQNKGEETKFDFFDMDFNHLNIRNGHPNASIQPEKPQCFDEMKELAEKLAKGIPQLRVDFYEVNGRVFFGEMTFFHWSGLVPFEPKEWDRIFGDWIELPEKYSG